MDKRLLIKSDSGDTKNYVAHNKTLETVFRNRVLLPDRGDSTKPDMKIQNSKRKLQDATFPKMTVNRACANDLERSKAGMRSTFNALENESSDPDLKRVSQKNTRVTRYKKKCMLDNYTFLNQKKHNVLKDQLRAVVDAPYETTDDEHQQENKNSVDPQTCFEDASLSDQPTRQSELSSVMRPVKKLVHAKNRTFKQGTSVENHLKQSIIKSCIKIKIPSMASKGSDNEINNGDHSTRPLKSVHFHSNTICPQKLAYAKYLSEKYKQINDGGNHVYMPIFTSGRRKKSPRSRSSRKVPKENDMLPNIARHVDCIENKSYYDAWVDTCLTANARDLEKESSKLPPSDVLVDEDGNFVYNELETPSYMDFDSDMDVGTIVVRVKSFTSQYTSKATKTKRS